MQQAEKINHFINEESYPMNNQNSFSIKKWSEDDRPREKLIHRGKQSLSNAELLGILINSGSREESAVALSQRILASTANNLNSLGKLTIKELMKFKGIGEAKAVTILGALELGRRRAATIPEDFEIVSSSRQVSSIMQPLIGDLRHEEFWVLYLCNSNKILLKKQLSRGGQTGTVVDTRLVLSKALEVGAVGVILAHNHPSGGLRPSGADLELTQKIKAAARILDIKLLDHLIITEKTYFSFADEGIL